MSLLYSVDDGVTFNPIPGAQEIDNTGTFRWRIPDERTDLTGRKAMIRVKDSYDTSGIIQNNSAPFTISWYTIKFYVIDKDTYAPMVDLNVSSNPELEQNFPGWEVIEYILDAPVYKEFPHGIFIATWKTSPTSTGLPDYFDRSIEFTANASNAKSGVLVEMENRVSAMIEWHVILTSAYNPAIDKLESSFWLERRGKLQEPIPKDTNDDGIPDTLDKSNFKSASLRVYDYDTDTDEPVKIFDAITPDDKGLYKFTWDNTNLAPNRTYFVRASIVYGTGTGQAYTSGASFDVSSTKDLYQLKEEHAEQTTLLKTIQTQAIAIQTAVEQTIPQKLTEATTSIEEKLDATKKEIKDDTARILTATEQTIPTQITEKVEHVLRSEILNRESTVRLGTKFMVRYRTYTGLVPTVDVYDPRNMIVVAQAPMAEVAGSPGLYEYQVLFAHGWNVGDFTIICSETMKGTMDAMIITAIRTDLEEVASQVSTIMGTTTSLSNLKEIADTLNSQFSIIESALGKISTDLVDKVKEVASSATDIEAVYNQLVNVGKELKTLGANQNVNLSKLLEVSKDKRQDMKYLKNKTQELKAAMEVSQKMIDNIAHKPVTQTWFEYK